jgi:hypothetical protein
VDDTLIYGPTLAEHDARLREVLCRLTTAGFAISDTKCQFHQSSVVLLGHQLSGDSIRPDSGKVSALLNMKPPTNITEHQGLMGFANFLAQFLPHYSALTEPLRCLQSSKTHFKWTEDNKTHLTCLKSFLPRLHVLYPLTNMPLCPLQPMLLQQALMQFCCRMEHQSCTRLVPSRTQRNVTQPLKGSY